MSSTRITKNGKVELTIRHKDLPGGRKFFTFDTQAEADRYGEQWDLLVKAGLPPPAELLEIKPSTTNLGHVIRAWANSGNVAPTDHATLDLLFTEVGAHPLAKTTYAWTEQWVQRLKTHSNLAPSTIKKRVGSLSRAIDHHLRKMPDLQYSNPLKLLPPGYATYNERDAAMTRAAGHEVKEDAARDRRLHPGEDERIQSACTDDALRLLYLTIVNTGLRLKEAFTLAPNQVLLNVKVIRAKKSKLWRGKVAYKDVPIVPALFKPLSDYVRIRQNETYLFPFWGTSDEHTSARLSQRFRVVFVRAKCEGLTEHDLRHEATCRWFEMRGSDGHWIFRPEEIHKIMGWSPNSKMAMRYASFRGESLAERLWK